jgi:hypothetical protein
MAIIELEQVWTSAIWLVSLFTGHPEFDYLLFNHPPEFLIVLPTNACITIYLLNNSIPSQFLTLILHLCKCVHYTSKDNRAQFSDLSSSLCNILTFQPSPFSTLLHFRPSMLS